MSAENDDIPSIQSLRRRPMKDLFRKAKIWSKTQYKPLSASSNEIRLLRLVGGTGTDNIQCDLFYVSLNDPPSYAALSYCWGTNQNPKTIQVNGARFQVTTNLHAALVTLRSPDKDRILWIDAICIDQSNISERDSQVQMMGSIYKEASKVVVWLGPESDDSALGVSFVHDLNGKPAEDPQWMSRISTGPEYLPYLHATMGILRRDYWKRIWVIQEVANASDIVAYVGDARIDWSELSAISDIFKPFAFEIWHGGSFPASVLFALGPTALRIHNLYDGRKSTAIEMLRTHRSKSATDPRDKIIALVGITEGLQGHGLINYNLSNKELFKEVVKVITLNTGQINIIAQQKERERDPSLPSWVPDWGQSDYLRFFNNKGYSSTGDTQAVVNFDGDVMTIRAVKLAVIDAIGLQCIHPYENSIIADFVSMMRALDDWVKVLKQVLGSDEAAREAMVYIFSYDPRLQSEEEEFSRLNELLAEARLLLADTDEAQSERIQIQTIQPNVRISRLLIDKANKKLIAAGNLLGLGWKDASIGDIIIIPLGCSVPLILRPLDDGYYSLVEDAWVKGYMNGEILPLIEDKTFELEDFKMI